MRTFKFFFYFTDEPFTRLGTKIPLIAQIRGFHIPQIRGSSHEFEDYLMNSLITIIFFNVGFEKEITGNFQHWF